jgi:hypothetical protein
VDCLSSDQRKDRPKETAALTEIGLNELRKGFVVRQAKVCATVMAPRGTPKQKARSSGQAAGGIAGN